LATAADARRWAESSAPAMGNYWGPAWGLVTADIPGGCPAVTTSDAVTTLTGGCTDEKGQQWFGRATRDARAADDLVNAGHFTFDGFGMFHPYNVTCNGATIGEKHTADGDLTVSGKVEGGLLSFWADLKGTTSVTDTTTCAVTESEYAANYQGSERTLAGDDRAVWSGSGRVGNSVDGVVTVSTDGEVLQYFALATCDGPIAGGTRIQNATDTIDIFYDQAADCGHNPHAHWSLNGKPAGVLEGLHR
jgi:hypothetical protein